VNNSRPIKPGADILVPGEPELRAKAERLADGVPLSDETWASIVATARSLGADEQRIQAAGRAE
jgi:uncharacterized oxidoreductase